MSLITFSAIGKINSVKIHVVCQVGPWNQRKNIRHVCNFWIGMSLFFICSLGKWTIKRRRINIPCCWKQVAQRWKNSKAKFLFRERAFHFRDRIFLFRDRTVVWPSVARSDSPDREKGKFDRGNGKLSRGKEEPERFSSEEHSIFQQHGYIFSASKASWPPP